MGYFDPQNPGLSGIDELTDAEVLIVQSITALGTPAGDRILFWDVSAGGYRYLEIGTGLSITDTTLNSSGGSGANAALSNLASVAINASLLPGTSDSIALGSSTLMWSDLFLAQDGAINWNNGKVTIIPDSTTNLRVNIHADGTDYSDGFWFDKHLTILSASSTIGINATRSSTNDGIYLGWNVSSDSTYGLYCINGDQAIAEYNIGDGYYQYGGSGLVINPLGGANFGAGSTYGLAGLETVASGMPQFAVALTTDDYTIFTQDDTNGVTIRSFLATGTPYIRFQNTVTGVSDGSQNIGTSSVGFGDLYLAGTKKIDFANGNVTLTHSTGVLTLGGSGAVTLALGTNSITMSGSIGVTGTRVTKGWFTDIESTNAPTVGGVALPTASSTTTLTNKRITQRVVTTTDDSTAVIDVDVTDQYQLTAMANATTISTTGTPTAGQKLVIRLEDNGTARALTWDGVFRAIGVTLPTTTVLGKTVYIGCIYNATDTKWDAVAVAQEV